MAKPLTPAGLPEGPEPGGRWLPSPLPHLLLGHAKLSWGQELAGRLETNTDPVTNAVGQEYKSKE